MCQNLTIIKFSNLGENSLIGGPEIKPSGGAKVTTPAGSFDTTDISYKKEQLITIFIHGKTCLSR
ncbi:MAG: hypothetical protein P0116_12995 [Candidatus Nitrosocosmicus sp.]|nr:hypothetical protein [Candidatus Nitrosocosmicus sp.]